MNSIMISPLVGIASTLLWLVLPVFSLQAQDTLWVRYDNRFLDNKRLLAASDYDSLEFISGKSSPIIRCYTPMLEKGYFDYHLSSLVGSTPGELMFRNPGRIIYRPSEFSSMDFMDEDSKWCFKRSRESEHFIVFWEKGFGSNPNAMSVPSNLRVDIDDLLSKAEMFFATNVERLQMVQTGDGKSMTDRYKLQIYLFYQSEWLATGAGYDDKIGALWISPSTCQPVGSTIGHEIGHSFQYQTYCDNVRRGRPNDHQSGFRYGLPGSGGGNGFWEQCAQWQSFQDYPKEAITTWHVPTWIAHHHRHFENEFQRYASYWLHYYLSEKHDLTTIGRLWNESRYPEDALMAYQRLFCDGDYSVMRRQLFEYAQRCATFDFKAVKTYVSNQYDNYTTKVVDVGDGWWQVTYAHCPAPTGFNIIPLTVPEAGTKVTALVEGLTVGSPLPAGDEGIQVNADGKEVGRVTAYNTTDVKGKEGWMFGFVALKDNGERVYGNASSIPSSELTAMQSTASFTVPEQTQRLWLVVQGAPTEYRFSPWDDKECTDDQLPYRVKLTNCEKR